MGVDAGDADGDGDLDLFVTHLKGETNTLYLQASRGTWEDRTAGAGLAATSLPMNGFGTAFFDLDNDGLLDLLVVNGLVRIPPENRAFDDGRRLGQPDQLFHNLGKARFEELGGDSIPALAPIEPSRGVAFGDVDNDGDTDAVVTVNELKPRLLLNRAADGMRWIGLRLVTGSPPRDALGAEVRLTTTGDRVLLRRVHSDGGYAAGHDPRVILGLGADAAGRTLDVRWPSGRHEVFPAPPVGRYTTLAEGSAPKTSKETP